MTMMRIVLAATLAAATFGATAASAQPYHGYRHGWRGHHRVCHTEWRHHHRVRVCR